MTIATTTTPTRAPVLDPTYTIKLLIELSSSTAAQRNEIFLCYRGRGGYQCSHHKLYNTQFSPVLLTHTGVPPDHAPLSSQTRKEEPCSSRKPWSHQKVALSPTEYPLTERFPLAGTSRNGHLTTKKKDKGLKAGTGLLNTKPNIFNFSASKHW